MTPDERKQPEQSCRACRIEQRICPECWVKAHPQQEQPCQKCGGKGWYWMGGNDYRKRCDCQKPEAKTRHKLTKPMREAINAQPDYPVLPEVEESGIADESQQEQPHQKDDVEQPSTEKPCPMCKGSGKASGHHNVEQFYEDEPQQEQSALEVITMKGSKFNCKARAIKYVDNCRLGLH